MGRGHGFEGLHRALRPIFLNEPDHRVEADDGDDDEAICGLPNRPRDDGRDQQDEDHEIFELLDEHAEQRPLAPFGEHVGAVLGKAASHLLMAEAVWRRLQVVEDSVNRHGVPERHPLPSLLSR